MEKDAVVVELRPAPKAKADKYVPADRRRRALLEFMDLHQLTPKSWAEKAGFKNGNVIYNFLNGHSNSLSASTYEKLAAMIPGATASQLMGEVASILPTEMVTAVVKVAAEADVWRATQDLPKEKQVRTAFPIRVDMPGIYGVEVRGDGANLIYPDKTLLACVPRVTWDRGLRVGSKVIVARYFRGEVETTVREVTQDRGGRAWLTARTDAPELQGPIPLPWPYEGQSYDHDGHKVVVDAVVVGAWRPEV